MMTLNAYISKCIFMMSRWTRGVMVTASFLWILGPCQIAQTNAQENQFLAISDVHFDPFSGLDKNQFQQLANLEVSEWGQFFSKLKDLPSGPGSDSNYALFVSALEAAAKRIPDPGFVLYPGDFMAHDWQMNYNSLAEQSIAENSLAYEIFTTKVIAFMAKEFEKHFPNVPVFPTLGNDDSFCQDYWLQPNGRFLSYFAKVWKPLLGSTVDGSVFESSFSTFGNYVAELPGLKDHQLVVLNSVLWSTSYCSPSHNPGGQNCCGCVNPGQAPGIAQFDWLDATLQKAQQASKKVWLLMHVPPGLNSYKEQQSHGQSASANFWDPAFTARYHDIVHEYSDLLHISFTGHTHMDDYRIDDVNEVPVLLHKIVPSVSPIFGNNPAFQVYQFNSTNGVINNWQTYYLDLASITSSSQSMIWEEEYDAGRVFQLGVMNAKTMNALFRLIHVDPTGALASAYRKLYSVSSGDISPDDLAIFVCAILHSTFAEYYPCVTMQNLKGPNLVEDSKILRSRMDDVQKQLTK